MGIVQIALKRPYTFGVLGIFILIFGFFSISRMPTDVLPRIDIPVVTVLWTYTGLPADEMAAKITSFSELSITNNVDDVSYVESQTLNGVGLIRVYFQPQVDIATALAQVTSVSQTILKRMPTGTQPPLIATYTPSSVPILQLVLSSNTLNEAQLYDYGRVTIRSQMTGVVGLRLPLPFGGKIRQIMVDIDPLKLQSKGLSPNDINTSLNLQNLTTPSGTFKEDMLEYTVSMNSSPVLSDNLNNIPLKYVDNAVVYMRDIGFVRDGYAVQNNIVRSLGDTGVLLTILKLGGASTVDIVKEIYKRLPVMQASAPEGLKISPLFDQSLFVSAAIRGVLIEGITVGCLIGLLILLFTGSTRNTAVVLISIPLSILTSIIILNIFGQSLNLMSLGGLSLAIGILVDDATVVVENIHRNVEAGKSFRKAILDGTEQVVFPSFISTLSICIVFVPIFFLTGPAKYLFTPLAMAVIFGMAASYVLSRTVVPSMMQYLFKDHIDGTYNPDNQSTLTQKITVMTDWFEREFLKLRDRYIYAVRLAIINRRVILKIIPGVVVILLALTFVIGRNFFPYVDAGLIKLHLRTPTGTRIEESAKIFIEVEKAIKEVIPQEELDLIIDNIGLSDPINLGFMDIVTVGAFDGEILISLKEGHGSTLDYQNKIRNMMREKFPHLEAFFQPPDITNQILNFGLPSPIDIRIAGRDSANNLKVMQEIREKIGKIPGIVDVVQRQILDLPSVLVDVDRSRAIEYGLTQHDIAFDLLTSLSSSTVVFPNFWTDYAAGIPYTVAVQTPQLMVRTAGDLWNTPLMTVKSMKTQPLLRNLSLLKYRNIAANISRYNFNPMYNLYANVHGIDLGTAATKIQQVIDSVKSQLKPGNEITIAGQVESMNQSFLNIGLGLAFAIILVYLLMVVNFQSWIDPFIIITAIPICIAGSMLMLFITHTTFSVPALMGIIMATGVATANSILVVSFANDELALGKSVHKSILGAVYSRLRPVLLTASAMILGMIPMAIGFGEGGEQNAPLGRSVVGGLLFATTATLFFIPMVYTILKRIQVQNDTGLDTEDL
ncbi:efflux RND transporter permease subunit [Candidatus Paracaedibacter symbiosus]|uniref:efflux RND transporter permease subunit n=1 Tax=Candidatus Paracaedibacter symbiosus TaxID=244582 RepID=UPI000509ABAF|nr:efflux RND transporter permease subunit [Candidatus Paracaedibacter symbiosus]